MGAPISDVAIPDGSGPFWFELPDASEIHVERLAPRQPVATAPELEPEEPSPEEPSPEEPEPEEPEPEPELEPEEREEPEPEEPEPEPVPEPRQARGWTDPWGFELSELAAERRRRRAARERDRRNAAQTALLLPFARAAAYQSRRALAILAGGALLAGVAAGAGHGDGRAVHPAAVNASARFAALPRPSGYAQRTVPPAYLRLYLRAASQYGLDWNVLAAVGQIESRSGSSTLPGVSSGTNAAGAAGPAQFEASTWRRFGVDVDGRGQIDPYDPADAITSMAAYLKASGAPQDWRAALYAYNHSPAYVDAVLALSRRLVGPPA